MALKEVISRKAADEKTYEKLKRDLDFLPANHGSRARIQREHGEAKDRMAARRGAR